MYNETERTGSQMYCVNCGEKLTGSFCVECGHRVGDPVPESPAPASAVPDKFSQSATWQAPYMANQPQGPVYPLANPQANPYAPPRKKKGRSPLAAFLVTLGGLAAVIAIVFTVLTVVGNIEEPEPEPPPQPGLLESLGPNNYQPSDTPGLPMTPVDLTADYMQAITDEDIVGATQSFSITLTSGHYVAGVDFPVGSYMVYAEEGFGSFRSNHYGGRGYVNQLLGVGEGVPDRYAPQMGEVFFPKGTMVSFDGLTIRMESKAADVKNLSERENTLTETVQLELGMYTAGKDFEPGIYDVVAVEGTGSVVSSNDVAGISNAMSASPEGSHQVRIYHNVILAENTTIQVGDGLTIQLVPSTGKDY